MHKNGFNNMVKGLLAWLNKVFRVLKCLWSNFLVNHVIYHRKITCPNKALAKTGKINHSSKCQPTFVKY